ncbi:hypothetical protein FPSE_01498 [Fusarium pseudograminearum CS3096]|uniref:Uncharacterized protein n=1 Tax=Fusarium pseudograminearum (strain CS3096) TaxID=1028729 RepID=K3VRW7_FUSPC|nr:hypothetical protein FPSE_01498 [Fusarium pseudograminearum CS3096]EKJ78312.1 hypothetical protein FPSE_01498 [Fusarium pseudograminearum CS3096]
MLLGTATGLGRLKDPDTTKRIAIDGRLMTVKSLDTVPASHGDLHLEIDHLGGSEVLPEKGLEAQSEIDQGARDLEVRAPGAPSPLDPIVMCLEDTHHVVGREVVEAIAIGGNDQEQSERARAEESVSVSGRSSPRPSSVRARSPLQSREQSPHHTMLGAAPLREAPRPAPYDTNAHAPVRSPPRGPAALRAPPTGPAANRNTAPPVASPAPPPPARIQTPTAPPQRSDTTSPTIPPAGPRGYVPPARGGFAPRGGRGGWNQPPTRQFSGPSPTPSTTNGPSAIPTGPRAAPSNVPLSSTPTQSRPFNPPTGPSAQHAGGARQTLAQSMLATLPPIIPGGKLDPSMTPISMGVTRELEPHYRKLKDEEEKVRDELHAKQERLRKSIYTWNRLERDSRAWEMRSDLSEKSMKNLAGEGMGGAAF